MEVTKTSEARRQTKAESEDTQVCDSGTAIVSSRLQANSSSWRPCHRRWFKHIIQGHVLLHQTRLADWSHHLLLVLCVHHSAWRTSSPQVTYLQACLSFAQIVKRTSVQLVAAELFAFMMHSTQ